MFLFRLVLVNLRIVLFLYKWRYSLKKETNWIILTFFFTSKNKSEEKTPNFPYSNSKVKKNRFNYLFRDSISKENRNKLNTENVTNFLKRPFAKWNFLENVEKRQIKLFAEHKLNKKKQTNNSIQITKWKSPNE